MFLGVSAGESGSNTDVIVDFGGLVKQQTVNSQTMSSYKARLTVGDGFVGYMTSIGIYNSA